MIPNEKKHAAKPDLKTIRQMVKKMKFEYDYFISYASEDAYKIINPLIAEMKKSGITYFLDREQIAIGESLNDRITHGINRSRFVLAIITANSIKKPWVRAELNTILHLQITSGRTRLHPVLCGPARQVGQILDAMPLLRDLHYIQWSNNPGAIVQLLIKILNK